VTKRRLTPRKEQLQLVQLVVLVSAFVVVSTDWSVYCWAVCCSSYSRCPPCPAICFWSNCTRSQCSQKE